MTGPTAEQLSEVVAEAVDVAIAVARRDGGRVDGPPVPSTLKPFLRFSRFPTRARTAVIDALDSDDDFRRRVAESVDEADMGRAGWIFLARPDGWAEELAATVEDATETRARATAQRREQSAERRLEQANAAASAARAERDAATADRDAMAERLEDATSRSARLRAEGEDLQEQRARAVRQLKEVEALAAARLEELRDARARIEDLEADLARAAGDEGTSTPLRTAASDVVNADEDGAGQDTTGADAEPVVAVPTELLRSIAELVGTAAGHAEGLGVSLDAIAAVLGSVVTAQQDAPGPPADATATPPASAAQVSGAASAPRRRTAHRLRGGVVEDTAEAITQLLRVEGLVAVIDGYNVTMQGWPTVDATHQRRLLIAGLGALQNTARATIHVVFDGDDDGRRTVGRAALPVRVHFSHAEVEADDLILEMVSALPAEVPVLVVSSDRRVADGARSMGANAASSAALLSLLRP